MYLLDKGLINIYMYFLSVYNIIALMLCRFIVYIRGNYIACIVK